MSDLKVIEVNSDLGGSVSGSKFGPKILRESLFPSERYTSLASPLKHTVGNTHLKNFTSVFDLTQRLTIELQKNFKAAQLPIILSGDHSSGLAAVGAARSIYLDEKIALIWIDAHADMHSPWTSHSGNLHGMPIAASLGWDHRWQARNEVTERVQKSWNQLKNLAAPSPWIQPEDVFLIGLRDFEPEEMIAIKKFNIFTKSSESIFSFGIDTLIIELQEKLQNYDRLIVSFDLDVMDSSIMKATGLPTTGGLYWENINQLFNYILNDQRLLSFELSEFNPLLDSQTDYMSELKKVLSPLILRSQIELDLHLPEHSANP